MVELTIIRPLFDADAFAARLRPHVQELSVLCVATASRTSAATVSRASNGWPQLSHENYMRLSAWLDAREAEARNAA